MRLRQKTLIAIGTTLLGLILILYAAAEIIVMRSFADLEEQDTRRNVQRVVNALADELSALDSVAIDWAEWDDTYDFIESLDPDYVSTNIIERTFTQLRLNLMMFADTSGEIAFSQGFDQVAREKTEVSAGLLEQLSTDSLLLRLPEEDSSHRGIVILPEGPMMLAARPILTSEGKGPVRGAVVLGRYLDSSAVKRLAETTRLSVSAHALGDPQMPGDYQGVRGRLSLQASEAVTPLSSDSILGYALQPDIHGEPALLLRVDSPRTIYQQGQASLRYLLLSLLAAGLVFGSLTLLLLEKLVLSRLAHLSHDVSRIGASGDPSVRVSVSGNDELTSLAAATNGMLEALQQSQEKLRQSRQRVMEILEILESIADPFLAVDQGWQLVYANPKAGQLLGRSRDETTGQNLWEVLPRAHHGMLYDQCHGAVALGADAEFEEFSPPLNTWFEVHVFPHKGGASVYFRDITERKRLEEQLLRAQRLETAGRVAGQVAHDFNNLLGPLMAYPDLMRMQLPEGHPALEYCQAMIDAAERMAEINQDLMALGRRGHLEMRPTDLNELVQQALSQMVEIPETLQVRPLLSANLLPVRGAPAQLARVLSNLLSNARDAMHDSGVLTIVAENIHARRPFGSYNRIEAGEYVRVAVADTGCGIAPDIRDRIFDAFFTTKVDSRRHGCGLGLSVVQSIVADHQGHLDLESEPGKGATFSVYLPVCEEALQPERGGGKLGGKESLLLIEDDEVQQKVTRELLERLGYHVSVVADGEQALSHLENHAADLLILDMVLSPGTDGADSYRRVLDAHPGQKAIIVSAYAESERVSEARALGAGGYLQKPLTLEKLARAVRAELDHTPPPPPS